MVFDIIILVIILFSTLMASIRGFSREISSLLAFLLAILSVPFALRFGRIPLSEHVQPTWLVDTVLIIVSFLVVYIFSLLLFSQWRNILVAGKNEKASFLDTFLGSLFGFFRGVLLSSLFLIVILSTLSKEVQEKYLLESFTYPYILKVSEVLTTLAPEAKKALKEVSQWEQQK